MAFGTASGREAFGHLVTVGWLDRIRIGLIDHDGMLYLASYD